MGALIAALLLAAGAAAEEGAPATGLNPTHPGHPLYQHHCAECHGVFADGKGPRAAALDKPPPDLTRLGDPKGEQPRLDALTRSIDGRRTLRAHGTGGMPVWGEKLAEDVPDWRAREEARIRLIQSLAEYLLSIQRVKE